MPMDILNQIYEAVQETNTKVNELVEWKAGMDEHILNQDRMLDGVRKTVYGNVQRLLNGKENSIKSSRNFWLYILRTIIAAVIVAAIIGVMGFLLVLYAKFGKGS